MFIFEDIATTAAIKWRHGTNQCSVGINPNDANELLEVGSSFEDNYVNRRFFENGPKYKFISSSAFIGSKYGYIFQMGPKGLGYYIDTVITNTRHSVLPVHAVVPQAIVRYNK